MQLIHNFKRKATQKIADRRPTTFNIPWAHYTGSASVVSGIRTVPRSCGDRTGPPDHHSRTPNHLTWERDRARLVAAAAAAASPAGEDGREAGGAHPADEDPRRPRGLSSLLQVSLPSICISTAASFWIFLNSLQLFVPHFLMQEAVFDIVHRGPESEQEGAVPLVPFKIPVTLLCAFLAFEIRCLFCSVVCGVPVIDFRIFFCFVPQRLLWLGTEQCIDEVEWIL